MIVLEIPPNDNCEAVDQRVFNDLGAPQPVNAVRLLVDGKTAQWCALTGWTLEGKPVPALAQKVDDSGEGVVYLIHGGSAGLRLSNQNPPVWDQASGKAWGEPFLLIADPDDLRFV